MPVLSVADLRKSYGGREVVAGVSFQLQAGECFGLLGPNGAGKTTILRMCLGLTEPDGGSIDLLGHTVPAEARRARAKVGIVPQLDNLDPDFTVAENLLVYGRYFGLTDALTRKRIPELLEFAGLGQRADARINTLSGGMKRRLTLARALVNDPELIIMDEPTTGLDPQARHLIWDRLRQLLTQGKTILLTTHFMDEAERLCGRLIILDNGKLIAGGPPRQLIGEQIEAEVVEVYGEGLDTWLADSGTTLALRIERAGETAFCYSRDSRPLMRDLAARGGLRYLHRPANLEDVFLKLTGRDLRD